LLISLTQNLLVFSVIASLLILLNLLKKGEMGFAKDLIIFPYTL